MCESQGSTWKNSPTTIRQDITVPSLQDMGSANLFERLLSRLEPEVISVVETEVASRPGQLLGRQTLERGLGCNGHEHRKQHGPVGERQV